MNSWLERISPSRRSRRRGVGARLRRITREGYLCRFLGSESILLDSVDRELLGSEAVERARAANPELEAIATEIANLSKLAQRAPARCARPSKNCALGKRT